MKDITWPEVAMAALLFIGVLAMLVFLAWLAKYWDVFGDEK